MYYSMRPRGIHLAVPTLFFLITVVLFAMMQFGFYLDSSILRKIWVIVMALLPIAGLITAIKGRRGSAKPWLIIGNVILILTVTIMSVQAIIY
ncbi:MULTISPECIES: hypothetical protein [Priestia]|uniref:Uncharacterized protein n=3 Tax=Priestia TaxID=2800373 RepID=A0ABD4X3U1_PRIMG|nr:MULTISPECIES: hypothetical protein [Priestia]MCF6796050.1 hypothetical protein [Bacillus sp. ET1]MDH6654831.1 hypothetical protein [Bacillus sp. PvP124]MDP9575030.1 hypothetical protein [Bacillus sp. 1751]MEB2276134.1 hypothetical protein [Bacillus sp. ILBB4]UYO27392.1 hypothetical protein LDP77_11015 [Bacillus sp. T_4]